MFLSANQRFETVHICGNMGKVIQYPHYLFRQTTETKSVQDSKGNWTNNAIVKNEFVSMCRQESDGRGTEYMVADGTFHQSTSVIQCPKGIPAIAKGETIVVANDAGCEDVRCSGVCLNFDPAQMHTRIWL